MKSIFGEYTERTEAHGSNLKERYEKDTDRFIMESFENSPTYREIEVYEQGNYVGIKGVRVNMIERMGNIRNLLLKPGDDLQVGNMARFEQRDWLLYDKFGYHEVGVKMTAMRTNYVLKWKRKPKIMKVPHSPSHDGTELGNCKVSAIKELIDSGISRNYYFDLINKGKTKEGIDVLKDEILKSADEVYSIKCYASSSDIGSKSKQSRANIEFNKYDVKLPYGQLYIFMEMSEASMEIDLNHRFIINGIVYEVIGLDNTTHVENNYGIIQFTVKRTTRNPKDNFELGIAYNEYLNEERSGVAYTMDVEVDEEKGRGGKIW